MSPIELEQVLMNLLKNSISVIRDNSKLNNFIEFIIKKDKKYVYLSVVDSGGEIKDLDSVFSLFKSTKSLSHNEAFGLGLNLSRSILRSYGGDLYLNSTSVEETIFVLKIPTSP
jgi:signal transduction histidine kinase